MREPVNAKRQSAQERLLAAAKHEKSVGSFSSPTHAHSIHFSSSPKISLPVGKTLTNPMQGLAGNSFLPDGKEPAKAQGAYPSFLSFRKKENQEDEIREMSFLCETLLWTRAKKLPTYPASILWVTPRPPR